MAGDISVPLINTNARLRCDFQRNNNQAWFPFLVTLLSVIFQAAGWFFATLFVVGVTGVIRKD